MPKGNLAKRQSEFKYSAKDLKLGMRFKIHTLCQSRVWEGIKHQTTGRAKQQGQNPPTLFSQPHLIHPTALSCVTSGKPHNSLSTHLGAASVTWLLGYTHTLKELVYTEHLLGSERSHKCRAHGVPRPA